MVMGARLDGHLVQGHVDQTARVSHTGRPGWQLDLFSFDYDPGKR